MDQGRDVGQEIVEIRVHGVHGTPPAAMLGVDPADVRQVAGDNLTGLYRSRSEELPYRTIGRQQQGSARPRVSVEAYSWGSLTSGVRGFLGWLQRALWLLLLPFALVNLAYWARLSLDGHRPASRWGARFTRLGGLLLTAFMLLLPCLIAIDLVAWQCYRGGSPGCTPLPRVLDFMADLRAGQRMAVASVVPLLVVAMLWFLSRQSLQRYEDVTPDPAYRAADPSASTARVHGSPTIALRHEHLWSGKQRTLQLQRAHLVIALATVVAFSGVHAVGTPDGRTAPIELALVLTVVVVLPTVGWTLTLHPQDVESVRLAETRVARLRARIFSGSAASKVGGWVRSRLPGFLLLAMTGVVVLQAFALWSLPGDLEQDRDFLGHNFWFLGIFVVLTGVHLLLFTSERMTALGTVVTVGVVIVLAVGGVAAHLGRLPGTPVTAWVLVAAVAAFLLVLGVWHWRGDYRQAHTAQAWNGAGPSVLLAAAGWVMLLFTTGGVIGAASYLNGSQHGVDDLVSELGDDQRSTVLEGVAQPGAESRTFRGTGDVVVTNAVITLGAGGSDPIIRSGAVMVERLYDVDPRRMQDLNGVALQKGRVRLTDGELTLESDVLRLEDSCVRLSESAPCSAESSRFLVGGQLQLPASRLSIGSDAGVKLVPSAPPASPLVVPQVLIWAPLAQAVWLVASAVWVLFAYALYRSSTRSAVEQQVASDHIPQRERDACVKARLKAGFAHRAERLVDGIGIITSVLVVSLIVASATGEAPWVGHENLRPFATAGMFVALGTALALVLLASRVRTSEGTRRAVGVLWDLSTFWPRAAHPLAPPCYAERVVPELRTRADWVLHLRDHPGPETRSNNLLVLSGHSQGSLIVCAVLSRMSAPDLARTRVITYGSQVRALYGRVFPAVFGPEQIGHVPTVVTKLADPFPDTPDHQTRRTEPFAVPPEDERREDPRLVHRLHSAGSAWVNLFRRSDPLGYRVLGDVDAEEEGRSSLRFRDEYVPEVPDVIVGDAGPRVNTHSGYQHTHRYRKEVSEWTQEPVRNDSSSTADLPALPT